MNTTTARPASQATIDFINSLKEERDLTLDWDPSMAADSPEAKSVAARAALEASRTVWRELGYLPQTAASTLIDFLKAAPKIHEKIAVDNGDIEGMHYLDEQVYKVQRAVHGSGNLYAKVLVGTTFEYAPGVIRKLSQETKMTLEQAQKYGRLYGICCQCGRTLTDEKSIAAGIGPVCAGRF